MHRRPFLGLAAGLAGCTTRPGAVTRTPTAGEGSPGGAGGDGDTVAWSFDAAGAVEHAPLYASALDASRPGLFVPTDGGILHSLDPADGRERWRADVGSAAAGSPLAAHGRVYAIGGKAGHEGEHVLHAVDADGDSRWTFSAGSWWLEPLGTDERSVFVGTEDDAIEDGGETAYALDPADGTVRWEAGIGDPYSAAVAPGALYVAWSGAVRAFDAGDGTERWTFDEREYQFDTLRADGERAYFATDHSLRAHGAAEGEPGWTFDDWRCSSVTLADALYAGGEHVARFDPATGEERWQADGYSFLAGGPVHDGVLYAGGGGITAYGTEGGTTHWSWDAEEGIVVARAADDRGVYVGTSVSNEAGKTRVYALDRSTGERRWSFEADTRLTDLVLGEHVYVGSADGTVYALGP